MKLKRIRLLIFSVFCLISFQSFAQEDYKAEIGVSAGGSYYIGDVNSLPFSNMNPAFSGYLRYNFDPRLAARAELTLATISKTGSFNNRILAGDICGEFNFFELEKNENKQFSKTYSPYIFAGMGMMTEVYKGQKLPEFSIPFGVGFKVKLGNRWNLDLKWSNRLLLADNLEGTTKPSIPDPLNNSNRLNGSNFLNNDLLSTFTIGLSFDIWKKHCDCENSTVLKDSHNYIK